MTKKSINLQIVDFFGGSRPFIIIRFDSLKKYTSKYLRVNTNKDTYLIFQKKYLRVYENSFGAKILRDDFGLIL